VTKGDSITAKGVIWSKFPKPGLGLPTKTNEGKGSGTFSTQATNLEPNTTYYIRAYATNFVGTTYSADSTFLTATSPIVTTKNANIVDKDNVESGGNVKEDGRMPVTARGVCWSMNHNPTASLATKTNDGSGTGAFNSTITGMVPNTVYYIRAYAINAVDTAYGEEKEVEIVLADAETGTTESIDESSARLTGKVNAGGQSTHVYFEYGQTIAYGDTISGIPANISSTIEEDIYRKVDGLTEDTEYHYRVVAENAIGKTFGADSTFRTTKTIGIRDSEEEIARVFSKDGSIWVITNNASNVNYTLYDMLGQQVASGIIRGNQHLINVNHRKAYYILNLVQGNERVVVKVWVE
jgi:predicted transcriptional regulator